MARALAVLCTLGLLATAGPTQGPPIDRYELGLRLRAFERELDAVTDAGRRAAAFVELDRGVQAFFRLDVDAVARAIDAAHAALAGSAPAAARAWARRLWLFTPQRLVDASEAMLRCELRAVPPPRAEEDDEAADAPPPGSALVLRLLPAERELARVPIEALPLAIETPLGDAVAGDHTLRWTVVAGGEELVVREQGLSVVVDRERRLGLLDERDIERSGLEGETLQALVRSLRAMTRERREETTLPGARLLGEAEELAALPAGERYYGDQRPGQFWLRVPTAAGAVSVRLVVPTAGVPTGGRPLVLALHGAGGSENLFCDGYGDGAIVRLCAARGWLLCAPRSTGFTGVDLPALVDALAARFEVDRERVFVVGHSMGAMQAVGQATRAPERFAAVAALGGGGTVRARAGLAGRRFYVGAGSRDFGRAGALALHRNLVAAGAAATFHEYADVEHLAVVQVALPDVFSFFDDAAKAPTGTTSPR